MSRKNLVRSAHLSYFVSNRSNHMEWFYISQEESWQVFSSLLSTSSVLYGAEIHAFVLSPNSYTMILSTPLSNLDRFMRYFQRESCREILRRSGRINHVFGARYKWSLLGTPKAVAYSYKYLLRSSVRAGLVTNVEDYRFSSASRTCLMEREIPLVERFDPLWILVPRSHADRMKWLNFPSTTELEELVGNALRRSQFQFSKGNEIRLRLEKLAANYGVESAPAPFSAEK